MSGSNTIKYGIIIDTAKCIDCKACLIACKVENNLPQGFWRNWIKTRWNINSVLKSEFQPGQCMQCDEPSCVAACPVGATYKVSTGLVAIDAETCIGCGNCVTACPYQARYRDPKRRIANKCDFCQHRLKRGEEPACIVTCPTKARTFGDQNDPKSTIAQLAAKKKWVRIFHPLVNTRPNILYLEGTHLRDWPTVPTLPGDKHMQQRFWKT